MIRFSLSVKLAIGLSVAAAMSGANGLAHAQNAPKTPAAATKAAPTATPMPKSAPQSAVTVQTPVAQTPAVETLPQTGAVIAPKVEEKELSLLEIFPVQEPLSYKNGVPADTKVDESLIAEKAAAGEVWVNSNSGVFHKPGTTYYGKTKKGFFMPEAQALEKGYHGVGGQ